MLEHESSDGTPLYGVAAEFATPEGLVSAARALHGRSFGRIDTYTPQPVPELDKILDMHRDRMEPIAAAGWVLGALGLFGMAVYATVFDYRFNIGGRPLLSWPYYIVPSFAIGVLVASVVVTLGLLALCRLPRLNHPSFNIRGFESATQDRFWLCIEPGRDGGFDPDAIETAMVGLSPRPLSMQRVPR
jgi:hypothetical protein